MTRKQLRDMGITDEEQITAILNTHRGEIEDVKEAAKPAQPKPAEPVKPQPKPAEQTPATAPASAPDEVEQLRRELAAEKQRNADRERRDLIVSALGQHKPKNADVLYKLLDSEKIVIKDGKVEGLDDQIKAMKADQGYLFSDTADDKGGAEHRGAAGTTTMNDIIKGMRG